MPNDEFFHLVQKHFGYLTSELGFRVMHKQSTDHFDNEQVVYQSVCCRIRVSVDRGEVYVEVAPLPPEEQCWIELSTMIAFLRDNYTDTSCDIEVPRGGRRATRLERQIQPLAALLAQYCSEMCSLFSTRASEQLCPELTSFGLQRLKRLAQLRWPNSVDF